jgi:Tfp pilus assembly protein PilW
MATRRVLSRRASPHREVGATLFELTVAQALVGLVLVGTIGVWSRSQTAYIQGAELSDLQQNVRIGYERMSRELRLAGMAPCDLVTPPGGAIASGTSLTSITITYRQADPETVDCATSPPPTQTVTYSRNAGTRELLRNGQSLVGTVESLSFQYFRCDGTTASLSTAAERSRIARVSVQIATRVTTSGQPLTRTLSSDIKLRNLACDGVL